MQQGSFYYYYCATVVHMRIRWAVPPIHFDFKFPPLQSPSIDRPRPGVRDSPPPSAKLSAVTVSCCLVMIKTFRRRMMGETRIKKKQREMKHQKSGKQMRTRCNTSRGHMDGGHSAGNFWTCPVQLAPSSVRQVSIRVIRAKASINIKIILRSSIVYQVEGRGEERLSTQEQ